MVKLSIVIPTKNRYQTLINVVESMHRYIIGNDYEIVVHDNSTEKNKNIVDTLLSFPTVKYIYSSDTLSQVENSEKALSYASGSYVVFIGDDDLVSPYVMTAIEIMDAHNMECLIHSPANYYWEGVKFAKKTRMRIPESLLIPKDMNLTPLRLDSKSELKIVLENGAVSIGRLPQLYHAFVKRSVIEKIKGKFGRIIPGPCPDMSLAVSLTYVLDEYYLVNFPFTITGVSKHSAAGLGIRNEHVGKLEDQKFLPQNIKDYWNSLLPQVWTACTIWAQSVTEVMRASYEDDKINYSEFYARMLVREPYAKSYVIPFIVKFLKVDRRNIFPFIKAYIKQRLKLCIIFFIDLFLGGTPYLHFKLIKGVKSTDTCMEKLLSYKPSNSQNETV